MRTRGWELSMDFTLLPKVGPTGFELFENMGYADSFEMMEKFQSRLHFNMIETFFKKAKYFKSGYTDPSSPMAIFRSP